MQLTLPEYTEVDFSEAYPREVLSRKGTQDQIIHRLLDFSLLTLQLLTLQSEGDVKKSINAYQDVSLYPVKEQETSVASNGANYISKVVYEDAYYRIQVWYDQRGSEIKRVETKLD